MERRDVVFDEDASWNWSEKNEETRVQIPVENNTSTINDTVGSLSHWSPPSSPSNSRSNSSSSLQESSDETPPIKVAERYKRHNQSLDCGDLCSFGHSSSHEISC
ncbi:uncharacterized protein [Henckelia pumila]|uniref:uncharacterized protein isoform X2 n=1 Tax=Henckelia pumila TaxID=405737 RepID=UPI003C6E47EC